MDLALIGFWTGAAIVVFLGGWLGGISATVFKERSNRAVLLDLDYRLADLEGRVNREVKIRAGQDRQKGKRLDEEILDAARTAPATATPAAFPDLLAWRKERMTRAP